MSSQQSQSSIRVSIMRDKQLEQGGSELIATWLEDSADCIWIDITHPTKEDIEPLLEEWFRFHELATEDSLSPNTQPKYDRFERYDFLVFRGIGMDGGREVATHKLASFLGRNFLLTIHKESLDSIDGVWNRLPRDKRILERGPDFVLYSVLDHLVDAHFPLLENVEERMDEIHELIFKYPSQSLLDELLDLKRELNIVRRHTLPQRELFNQISRGDAQFIQRDHLIYFRDLYDHTFRIGESIDVERDLASTTMEAYLSVVANRTNDIMKVLTIISTVLLPMNFIAGVYGMNFQYMPELRWHYGYLWALLLMLTFAVSMLLGFWKKGWLWTPRKIVFERERRIRKLLARRGQRRDAQHDDEPTS